MNSPQNTFNSTKPTAPLLNLYLPPQTYNPNISWECRDEGHGLGHDWDKHYN